MKRRGGPCFRTRYALLGLFAVVSACAPSHLELAKEHHSDGLAALRRGDGPKARGQFEATLSEARKSVETREEKAPRQARLLEGSALLRMADGKGALSAFTEVHALGPDAERPFIEQILTADTCELLRGFDVAHAEALCWTRVLDLTPPAEVALRVRAATEYGNALARRLPHTGTLLGYGDDTFQRFVSLALAQPLDVDVLFLLARRMPLFCEDPAFKSQLAGHSELQRDLLNAALALGWFQTERARIEAAAYLQELDARPLCGGAGPPAGAFPVAPAATSAP